MSPVVAEELVGRQKDSREPLACGMAQRGAEMVKVATGGVRSFRSVALPTEEPLERRAPAVSVQRREKAAPEASAARPVQEWQEALARGEARAV